MVNSIEQFPSPDPEKPKSESSEIVLPEVRPEKQEIKSETQEDGEKKDI